MPAGTHHAGHHAGAVPARHGEPPPTPGHQHLHRQKEKEKEKEKDDAQKNALKSWWRGFSGKAGPKKEEEKEPVPQGIFGIPLQTSIRYANVAISLYDQEGNSYIYGYVPIVVAKCGVFLKEKATDVEGIFRLSGSEKRIKELRLQFDSPDRYGKGLDWTGYTVHDAANILRRYFNQLPEPIIPLDFYDRFREPLRNHQAQAVGHIDGQAPSVGDFDMDAAIRTYQGLIQALPPLNRQLLLYILDLLAVFSNKHETNKMPTSNLAAIFQPGILSHPSHDMAPPEYRLSQDVLIFLIDQQDHFLIGMKGTAADEKTVKEIESGPPTPSARTPTASGSKKGLGRSSSGASAGADSIRRFGGVRRNVSVSSRGSRHSSVAAASPVTPGFIATPTNSSSGVHRSNTVPSKKSPGLHSPRFFRDNSRGSGPNTPDSTSQTPPADASTPKQLGSEPPEEPSVKRAETMNLPPPVVSVPTPANKPRTLTKEAPPVAAPAASVHTAAIAVQPSTPPSNVTTFTSPTEVPAQSQVPAQVPAPVQAVAQPPAAVLAAELVAPTQAEAGPPSVYATPLTTSMPPGHYFESQSPPPTQSATTPTSERTSFSVTNFLGLKTPPSENRKPNKLQKKRQGGSRNPSAHSSTQSLTAPPSANFEGPPSPASPNFPPQQAVGASDKATSSRTASLHPSEGPSTHHLRPTVSPTTSFHSGDDTAGLNAEAPESRPRHPEPLNISQQANVEVPLASPASSETRRRLWRLSGRGQRDSSTDKSIMKGSNGSGPLEAPRKIGGNIEGGRSASSVNSFGPASNGNHPAALHQQTHKSVPADAVQDPNTPTSAGSRAPPALPEQSTSTLVSPESVAAGTTSSVSAVNTGNTFSSTTLSDGGGSDKESSRSGGIKRWFERRKEALRAKSPEGREEVGSLGSLGSPSSTAPGAAALDMGRRGKSLDLRRVREE